MIYMHFQYISGEICIDFAPPLTALTLYQNHNLWFLASTACAVHTGLTWPHAALR